MRRVPQKNITQKSERNYSEDEMIAKRHAHSRQRSPSISSDSMKAIILADEKAAIGNSE
jgi:hypothetical protein